MSIDVRVQVPSLAPPSSDENQICGCGGMADALASGASVRKDVGVQVPPSAPNQYNPNLFPIGDGFGLFVFFDSYEATYFRNGMKPKTSSKQRRRRGNQDF